MRPNPYVELTRNPAAFSKYSFDLITLALEVRAIMNMMSRHVSCLLASRVSAIIPAAMGAAADVAVWLLVHLCLRSVVAMLCCPRFMSPFVLSKN